MVSRLSSAKLSPLTVRCKSFVPEAKRWIMFPSDRHYRYANEISSMHFTSAAIVICNVHFILYRSTLGFLPLLGPYVYKFTLQSHCCTVEPHVVRPFLKGFIVHCRSKQFFTHGKDGQWLWLLLVDPAFVGDTG